MTIKAPVLNWHFSVYCWGPCSGWRKMGRTTSFRWQRVKSQGDVLKVSKLHSSDGLIGIYMSKDILNPNLRITLWRWLNLKEQLKWPRVMARDTWWKEAFVMYAFLTQFLFQLRTLATSSNRNASTETKYNSRRIVIEKQFPSYQVKLNGVCVHWTWPWDDEKLRNKT